MNVFYCSGSCSCASGCWWCCRRYCSVAAIVAIGGAAVVAVAVVAVAAVAAATAAGALVGVGVGVVAVAACAVVVAEATMHNASTDLK